MRRHLLPLLASLFLCAGASATPAGVPQAARSDHGVPPGPPDWVSVPVLEVPAGPPSWVSVPVFEVPVGPPEGVPPQPNTPAHGQFPLGDVPPVRPPVGPPSMVPEPGTALLLLGGLLGLARPGRLRRERR